jgi:hypothetical protein
MRSTREKDAGEKGHAKAGIPLVTLKAKGVVFDQRTQVMTGSGCWRFFAPSGSARWLTL